jgi:hypothetical protein
MGSFIPLEKKEELVFVSLRSDEISFNGPRIEAQSF